MKRGLVLFLVMNLLVGISFIPLNMFVNIYGQSYMGKGYCDVVLKENTLYFYLVNPSNEDVRHVYPTSQHLDYYIFGKDFFYHYSKNKQFVSAITYVDVLPSSKVLLDQYTLPSGISYPIYVYVDFLVCRPRLFAVYEKGISEDIPSLFSVALDMDHFYVNIGQTLSVKVSVLSRVPLVDDVPIDIDFSPPPVLTIFYEDGSIDSETFTGTTVRLSVSKQVIMEKRIRVKKPIKGVYVLLDGVSFSVDGGNQYIEKLPPVTAKVYTVFSSEEPAITGVPYWAEKDVFAMYKRYVLPQSIFINMEGPASREEIMRGISSLLAIPAMSFSHTFVDVRRFIWGSYLSGLYWYHIIQGFPDGTVKGDAYITRAQMAALLSRILPPNERNISFSDVDKDSWYYPYIRAISGYDILRGWNGKFYPNKPVSKAEGVVILYRILQILQGR